MTDATHDPSLKSWVETANDPKCDFAVQNLPFGVFSTEISPIERIGTAIGDQIVDLSILVDAGLLSGVVNIFDQSSLNAFMAMGPTSWKDIRTRLSALLSGTDPALRDNAALCDRAFVAKDDATLHLPIQVTEFTDFYASREHATNVGRMFRDPDKALMPNWLHMPVGYNGRASTIVVSGTDIIRPSGQVKLPNADAPVFQASAKLDIELEMGAIVGTPNAMGSRISPDEAEDMIFGYVLLNDWSARDIQIWEYHPWARSRRKPSPPRFHRGW
jgi:fumarylacetoacetase